MKKIILLILIYCNFIYADSVRDIYTNEIIKKKYNECVKWANEYGNKKVQYNRVVEAFKVLGISYSFGLDIYPKDFFYETYLCYSMSEDNLYNAIKELKDVISSHNKYFSFSVSLSIYSVRRGLDLYNSQEYQQEIEYIVNKYCDKCNK